MEAPIDLFPTITRKEIRDARKAEAPQEKKIMIDQVRASHGAVYSDTDSSDIPIDSECSVSHKGPLT